MYCALRCMLCSTVLYCVVLRCMSVLSSSVQVLIHPSQVLTGIDSIYYYSIVSIASRLYAIGVTVSASDVATVLSPPTS